MLVSTEKQIERLLAARSEADQLGCDDFVLIARTDAASARYTPEGVSGSLDLAVNQTLFEPPDVFGWRLGTDWFSTGTLLTRMNFASTLASNQRFNLGADAQSSGGTPESLLAYILDRLAPAPYSAEASRDLLNYVTAGDDWTGSLPQVRNKAAGLAHLIGGSSEYQFV